MPMPIPDASPEGATEKSGMSTGNVIGGIILLSIAKKVTVLAVARVYGFSRIYRKALKMTKGIDNDRFQHTFKNGLKVRSKR